MIAVAVQHTHGTLVRANVRATAQVIHDVGQFLLAREQALDNLLRQLKSSRRAHAQLSLTKLLVRREIDRELSYVHFDRELQSSRLSGMRGGGLVDGTSKWPTLSIVSELLHHRYTGTEGKHDHRRLAGSGESAWTGGRSTCERISGHTHTHTQQRDKKEEERRMISIPGMGPP